MMRLLCVLSFALFVGGYSFAKNGGKIGDPGAQTYLSEDLIFIGTIKSVQLADERDTWIPHKAVAEVDGKVYRGEPKEKEVSFLTINQGSKKAPKVGQKYLFHMNFNKGKKMYEDYSLVPLEGKAARGLIKTYDFITGDGLEEAKVDERIKLYRDVRIKEVKEKCSSLRGGEKRACDELVSKMEKERNDPVSK